MVGGACMAAMGGYARGPGLGWREPSDLGGDGDHGLNGGWAEEEVLTPAWVQHPNLHSRSIPLLCQNQMGENFPSLF